MSRKSTFLQSEGVCSPPKKDPLLVLPAETNHLDCSVPVHQCGAFTGVDYNRIFMAIP